jgi:eukaryotic-like serine/threonine-protein kinase
MMQYQDDKEVIDRRFVLEELLSQGGVGAVWRATQLPHGRTVALKLLRPEMAMLPHLRRRFAREARAASKLQHPNIAAVYESAVDEQGRMFMSMELIEGTLLTEVIRRGLCVAHVVELADGLLAGLAHAHARGVIHRDLKPGNVMLDRCALPDYLGVVKLVDFGIATLLTEADDGDTAHGEVVGTPRYMSPEQASGERQITQRSDLYNVGLILYELICGHPPFGSTKGLAVMSLHVHESVPAMVARPGFHLPESLEALIMCALEKEPARRWNSAAQMRQEIQKIRQDLEGHSEAFSRPRPLQDEGLGGRHSTVEEEVVSEAQDAPTALELPSAGRAPAPDQADQAGPIASFQRIPFVGRPTERSWMMDIVERTRRTGKGAIVLVEGEAGVGKTRLTMWLKEHVEEQGWFRGHIGAFVRGANTGLRGLQEIFDAMFGTRGLNRLQTEARIIERFKGWGQIDAIDTQALADFLHPDEGRVQGRHGSAAPGALFAVMVRALELAATHRPRLLIIDDAHWAGPELGDFLDFLAVEMRHRSIPLIVLTTIRSEDLPANRPLATRLAGLSRYVGETVERLPLGRLRRASGHELVQALLPVEENLTDIVYERSGGNPLHLLMLLRYLRHEGLLEWEQGLWRARDPEAVRQAVPPSLGDLFRVRIFQIEERYGTDNRLSELLRRAAVVGSRFRYDVLRELIVLEADPGSVATFDEDFERLLSEGLLVEVDSRRDEWYGFGHGLIRDFFLADGTTPSRVRRWHRLAAQAMAAVHGEQDEAMVAEIAAHWYQARDKAQALVWYRRAARTAKRSLMLRQALTASERALELMEDLLGLGGNQNVQSGLLNLEGLKNSGATTIEYLEMLVEVGDLYEGFGEFDASEKVYRRVVRFIGRQTDSLEVPLRRALARSWLGLGHIAWQRGDFEGAQWAFERVRGLLEQVAELVEFDANAALGLARVAWHRGEYELARRLAAEVEAASRGRSDDGGCAEAIWILGEVDRMLGHGEKARSHYARSLDLYQGLDGPTGIARNLLSMAKLARYQKNFTEAEQLYRRALTRYEILGDRRGAGQCFNGLGDVARFRARYGEAREHYDRALEIYQAMGAEYDVAVVLANLGLTAIALGEFSAARNHLLAGRALTAQEDYPYLVAGIEYNLALATALAGEGEQASLDSILELAERFPVPDLDYAQPLERLGELKAASGRIDEAVALWHKARDIYRELELEEDQARVELKIRQAADAV